MQLLPLRGDILSRTHLLWLTRVIFWAPPALNTFLLDFSGVFLKTAFRQPFLRFSPFPHLLNSTHVWGGLFGKSEFLPGLLWRSFKVLLRVAAFAARQSTLKAPTPPTSPVTSGILTVTPWFPFFIYPSWLVYILGWSHFRGCVYLLPCPPPLARPPLCVCKAAMFLTSFLLWMFMLSKQQVLSVSPTFTVLPRHGSRFSARP